MFSTVLREVNLFLRAKGVVIAIGVIVFSTLTTLALLAVQLIKLDEQVAAERQIITQVKNIASSLEAGTVERDKQFAELNRHMDCIVTFFGQPDRSQKAIADINSCALTTNESNVSSFQFGTGASAQPSGASSSSNSTQSPQSQSPSVAETPQSSHGTSNTQSSPPSSAPQGSSTAPSAKASVSQNIDLQVSPQFKSILSGLGKLLNNVD